MHYVYCLKSKQSKWLYIGSSSNLTQRIDQHNKGKVRSTKPYAPFSLVYYEAYADKRDALERERKLKYHGSAIGHLKNRIKYSFTFFD